MRHCHVARRKAQLNIVQTVTRGVFNILKCHAATSIQRCQDFHTPVKLRQKADQVRFCRCDLYMRNQCFKRLSRECQIKLTAKIENCLRADITIKVAMDIGQG